MKIENKQNISRMPEAIAIKRLPYCVLKILNGAETILNYQNKDDVVMIEFDDDQEVIHKEDFLNVKLVADNIYNSWVADKHLESSFQTLNNSMKIHDLATEQIRDIYNEKYKNKKKMIFIKGDDTGCGYWRMVLPARQLDEGKFFLDVSTVEVIYEYLLEYDIIFIQRLSDWNSFYVLQKLKRAGKKIIYDIDDNLFDLPEFHPAKLKFGNDARESAASIMSLCDIIITTTDVLKKTLIQYVGSNIENNVVVIPNAINIGDYEKRDIYPVRGGDESKPFRIMWGGSSTHEYDILMVLGALDRFLLNHKDDNVRLMIMGYLPMCIREKYKEKHWLGKIEFIEFKDIETYFNMIGKVNADVGIAPLVDCVFNYNKSNIKWQEYTIGDVPVFASNVPPYSNTISDGVDGLLLNTEDEWYDALERKFNNRDGDCWQEMVDNARKKIEERYDISNVVTQWLEVFDI